MNRYQKLVSNTAILAVGTFGSKLLVFLLMPLYTAWLTTSDYGTAELITGIANFLIPVACVGLSTGIFRFAAEQNTDREAVFSTSIALLGIGLGAFTLLSPLLLLIPYYRGYVWLIVLYVILADLQAVCAQYIRAIDRTTLFALQGILNTALTILFNIIFLCCFDMGVVGYVLSVILGNAVTVLFLIVCGKLWRVFRFSKLQKHLMGELVRFSLPMIPTTICWLVTDLSDRMMLTDFWNESLTGIYAAAYKIPTVVTLVASVFLQAWQFSAVAANADEEECKSFYSAVFGGFLSVIMIGASGLILLSRLLADLLLANDYFEAWQYMPTLLSAAALEGIVSFLATVYLVRKKSMHSFWTALTAALTNIVLNLILIPQMGALGAALATAASYALVMVIRMIDTHRMIAFRLCLPRLIVSFLLLFGAAAVMTLDIPGCIWWTLALTVVICTLNAPALITAAKHLLQRRKGNG